MLNLEYFNVKIERSQDSGDIIIKGEVTNKSGKNYTAVAVRLIVFVKNISVANVVILINGLYSGVTKSFAKNIEDLRYDSIAKDITRYEIYTESAY